MIRWNVFFKVEKVEQLALIGAAVSRVLFLCSEAREVLGSETPRVHHAAGQRDWPLAARAQQPGSVVRIGFVGPAIDRPSLMFVPNYQAFLAQLHVLGFVEGQNLIVTYGAVDDPRGLAVVAAELMQVQPELIVVSGTEPMLQSVRAASQTVPIVLIAVNFDPIARGYVASLARPGGNITGVVFQQLELAQKQVELLTHAFPGKTHLAALFDAQSADQFSAAERSARSLNLQMRGYKL